jgi:hypothetical protein
MASEDLALSMLNGISMSMLIAIRPSEIAVSALANLDSGGDRDGLDSRRCHACHCSAG